MPTSIALLRGINVGKAKRLPMADLRALLQGLGYGHVATLLNSGNAVFQADKGTPRKLAGDIASTITAQLGMDVPVIVKPAKELDAIVAGNTLAAQSADASRLVVAFVQDAKALPGLQAIAPLVVSGEQFVMGRHAAYLHCPNGLLASQAGKALLGKVGRMVTTRNWATVLKLQALAHQGGVAA